MQHQSMTEVACAVEQDRSPLRRIGKIAVCSTPAPSIHAAVHTTCVPMCSVEMLLAETSITAQSCVLRLHEVHSQVGTVICALPEHV